MDVKQEILSEITGRIDRLEEHAGDEKPSEGNEYAQLNHALSDVIGTSLRKELESLREFVQEL